MYSVGVKLSGTDYRAADTWTISHLLTGSCIKSPIQLSRFCWKDSVHLLLDASKLIYRRSCSCWTVPSLARTTSGSDDRGPALRDVDTLI